MGLKQRGFKIFRKLRDTPREKYYYGTGVALGLALWPAAGYGVYKFSTRNRGKKSQGKEAVRHFTKTKRGRAKAKKYGIRV